MSTLGTRLCCHAVYSMPLGTAEQELGSSTSGGGSPLTFAIRRRSVWSTRWPMKSTSHWTLALAIAIEPWRRVVTSLRTVDCTSAVSLDCMSWSTVCQLDMLVVLLSIPSWSTPTVLVVASSMVWDTPEKHE